MPEEQKEGEVSATTETQEKWEKDRKKMAYSSMGRAIQAEKKLQGMEERLNSLEWKVSTPDYGWYEAEQVNFISDLAKKRAEEVSYQTYQKMMKTQELKTIQHKEEEAFLSEHPNAFEYLDEIKRVKDMMPSRSFTTIWKGFYDNNNSSYQNEPPKSGIWPTDWVVPSKKVANDDQALDDDFNKLLGRK